MEKYTKPVIVTQGECRGIIPIAAFVAGLSAVDVAAAAGIAAGLAATLGPKDDFLPRRSAMNRLDFV